MSKNAIIAGLICLSASSGALAQAPLQWMHSHADGSGVSLSGTPVGAMGGAPMLRFSVREVAIGVGADPERPGYYSAPLEHFATPVGEPVMHGDDYGDGFAYRHVSQTYALLADPSKTVDLRLFMEYLPWGADWAAANGPAIRVRASAEWMHGIPARFNAEPATSVGLVVRSDHDVSGANNQGFEVANGVGGALSATAYASILSGKRRQWLQVPNQPLARFFDTHERENAAQGFPLFDMYLLNNDVPNDEYLVAVRTYQEDGGILHPLTRYNPQTTVEPPQAYPEYVRPGQGSDQVAYVATRRLRASNSSYEWLDATFLLVKRDHYRTVDLSWYYHDAVYGNPDQAVDDGNSVRSVLESLDPASPVRIETQQANLTCPGNDCSEAELLDLQYATHYDDGQDKSVLKTAVYVLRSDQTFAQGGGVVFPSRSHAFVFPAKLGHDRTAVYASIAHEIGHTFKFEHGWGRCKRSASCANGATEGIVNALWCCENGDIMSYAHVLGYRQGWQHYDFNYTDDAKRWFREAPLPFVESYVGGTPGALDPDRDDGLEPATVLGW